MLDDTGGFKKAYRALWEGWNIVIYIFHINIADTFRWYSIWGSIPVCGFHYQRVATMLLNAREGQNCYVTLVIKYISLIYLSQHRKLYIWLTGKPERFWISPSTVTTGTLSSRLGRVAGHSQATSRRAGGWMWEVAVADVMLSLVEVTWYHWPSSHLLKWQP